MAKIKEIRFSERKISPFGGLNFCIERIEAAGIPELITKTLGKRHGKALYSYADAIMGMVYGIFAGATRLEDMKVLKDRMHNSCLNIPSPDVLGKIMRNKLTKASFKEYTKNDNEYEINFNKPLNNLLVSIAKKTKVLNTASKYTLDFDHVPLPCEKYDSSYCFKGFKAYMPAVSWIGHVPVSIEMQ